MFSGSKKQLHGLRASACTDVIMLIITNERRTSKSRLDFGETVRNSRNFASWSFRSVHSLWWKVRHKLRRCNYAVWYVPNIDCERARLP